MRDYSKHSDIIVEAVVLFVSWLNKQNIYIYTLRYTAYDTYFMYISLLTHKLSSPFSVVFLWTLPVLYYKPRNCARSRRYIAVGTCIYKILIKSRSDFELCFYSQITGLVKILWNYVNLKSELQTEWSEWWLIMTKWI